MISYVDFKLESVIVSDFLCRFQVGISQLKQTKFLCLISYVDFLCLISYVDFLCLISYVDFYQIQNNNIRIPVCTGDPMRLNFSTINFIFCRWMLEISTLKISTINQHMHTRCSI